MKIIKRVDKWGVYAPFDGIVIATLTSPSDYGNRVYIKHTTGKSKYYHSILAHLDGILCVQNQEVKKGDLIGIMGSTGKGYPEPSKHLHWGLIPPGKPLKDLREHCINPIPLLINDNGEYPCNTKVSGSFQEWYGTYYHEGLDFSGKEENLIKDWKYGIDIREQRYFV